MSRVTANKSQIQQAYQAVKNDPQWTESCQLIEQGKPPSEMFRALAIRPDLLMALSAFSAPLYPGGLLERALQERVIVAVSQANECQYCTESHQGTLDRANISRQEQTAREHAALRYTAAAVSNPPRVTEELWTETRLHFSGEEIVELTLLIGLTGMLNRFNDCLNVRYNGDYESGTSPEPGCGMKAKA